MPWCHTCRVEYLFELDACPECAGGLTDMPAPERRAAALGDPSLVLLATLPAEQALVAAGRLDAGGIPSTLRDAGAGATMEGAVEVLVQAPNLAMARDVLRGPRRRRSGGPHFIMYALIATGIALFLSAAIFFGRWVLTGSPIPR